MLVVVVAVTKGRKNTIERRTATKSEITKQVNNYSNYIYTYTVLILVFFRVINSVLLQKTAVCVLKFVSTCFRFCSLNSGSYLVP